MRIQHIQCYLPKKFKSREKIANFFPIGKDITPFMPVTEKRFPLNFIQLRVRPWEHSPKYEYCICIKPVEKIPLDFSVIHSSNCLIRFIRTHEPEEMLADLYVQVM